MPNEDPPRSITELWYKIDKRLNSIELAQANHAISHTYLTEALRDHESRLRVVSSVSGLFAGAGGLLAIVALIKSFLGERMTASANPFKKAFYARIFTAPEIKDLGHTRLDLIDEIALMRVYIRRVSSALEGQTTYVDDDLKMLACMATITRAVGVLVRHQNAINISANGPVQRALDEATRSQRETWTLA